jgi:DNA-3-methyladenine glycosylase
VAIDLLGKYLVHQIDNSLLVGKIVETEAYLGRSDPASHAATKTRTSRSSALYQSPGMSYVYMIYGLYHCFNVVAHPEDGVGAVLIRAMEPIAGIEQMRQQRKIAHQLVGLGNGPGKLCQALGIDLNHNRIALYRGNLTLRQGRSEEKFDIGVSERVGISLGKDSKLRYFVVDSKFVSGGRHRDYELLSRCQQDNPGEVAE